MLDSEEDELDPEDADGVWVSVSFAVSTGVVVAGVVVASVGVVCSVVVVWVGFVSVDCVVEDAASGDCAGAWRAFVEPVECFAARFGVLPSRARAASPLLSAPFVALAVLPGKAWAASSVKIPVSVAEPASSQRLHCFSRLRAASRERLVGEVLTGTYSTL